MSRAPASSLSWRGLRFEVVDMDGRRIDTGQPAQGSHPGDGSGRRVAAVRHPAGAAA